MILEAIRERAAQWLLKQSGMSLVREDQEPRPQTRFEAPSDPKELLKYYREWVYACVTKNAEAVSAVTLRLYTAKGKAATPSRGRKTPLRGISKRTLANLKTRSHLQKYFRMDEDCEEVLEHPFLELWDNGNPFITGSQMRRVMVEHIDLVGDAYVFIMTDEVGPTALYTLPPEWMKTVVTPDGFHVSHYEQKDPKTQQPIRIPPDKIMHIKHPSPKSYILDGMAPLEAVGLSAKLYHEYNQFEIALVGNDGIPGTLISVENPMTETQKRRQERKWYQRYGGPKQAGKLAFVHGVKGIQRIGYSQREMMFQVGRKLTREDIAGVFNVPISLLVSDGSNLAHGHDAKKHHMTYAVQPRLVLIEEQINRDIISKYEGGENLFVAFDDCIPEDRTHNLERAKVMVMTSKLVKSNEVRDALELAPDEELEDEWVGGNPGEEEPVAPVPPEFGGPAEENPEEGEPTEPVRSKSVRQDPIAFEKALQQLFEQQRREIMSWLKKPTWVRQKLIPNVDATFDVDEWTNRYMETLTPIIESQLTAGMEEGIDKIGGMLSFDINRPEIGDFIGNYTYRFCFNVNTETQSELRKLFQTAEAEGRTLAQLTDEVQDRFANFGRYRAARIARTETARSRQAGEVQSWKQSGVVQGYYWQANSDACPFCLEIDAKYGQSGQHITFGENFIDRGGSVEVGEQSLTMNYSDIPHPPLHPNCRCELVPIFMGEEAEQPTPPKESQRASHEEFRQISEEGGKEWADGVFENAQNQITPEEIHAVDRYQGGGYDRINGELRKGRISSGARPFVKNIDAAIAKSAMPENVVLYRGFTSTDVVQNWNRIVGTTIKDKAFASTSISPRIARRFIDQAPKIAPKVLAEIHVPKGTKGLWMGSARASTEELEILLHRNIKFKVIKAVKRKGIHHLILEVAA